MVVEHARRYHSRQTEKVTEIVRLWYDKIILYCIVFYIIHVTNEIQ